MKKIVPILFLLFALLPNSLVIADTIKEIRINGNERIPDETILMFADINENDDINDDKINDILKDLYDSNFFNNISVSYNKNILTINLEELPIIDNIFIDGIKAKKYEEALRLSLILKPRSSFNEYLLSEEKIIIQNVLKNFGYYFATVDTYVEELKNNMVNIKYEIDLGNKAKIKKIKFIGDKIYKDKELKSIIISEEARFWKFISNKKYFNKEFINIYKRLLKNFYQNKGYYNVEIN